ncbi:MAG: exodeoxyribonuclease VII small subunit [Lachnospira sp.]
MARASEIEQSFERLEEIIDLMENGNLSLNDSFKAYKEGIKLVENCNRMLDKVEKQIVLINDNGDEIESDEEF